MGFIEGGRAFDAGEPGGWPHYFFLPSLDPDSGNDPRFYPKNSCDLRDDYFYVTVHWANLRGVCIGTF